MASISFYDMKTRSKVNVPEGKTRSVVRGKGNRKVRMLTAKGPKGNDMYRIVGRA